MTMYYLGMEQRRREREQGIPPWSKWGDYLYEIHRDVEELCGRTLSPGEVAAWRFGYRMADVRVGA